MLFGVLLTFQIILCVAMVGIILVQRSEGGALGMGGGPSGFMSARGAGNLLTRVTSVLAFLFFANCIALTIAGNMKTAGSSVVDRVGVDAVDPSKLAKPQPGQAQPAETTPAPAQNSLSNLPLPTQQLPQALPTPASQTAAPVTASSATSAAKPVVAQPAAKPATPAAKPAAAPVAAPVAAKPAPKPAAEPAPKPEAAKPAESPATTGPAQ